jgi:hypothetical protein
LPSALMTSAEAERKAGLPLRSVNWDACVRKGSVDANSTTKVNVIVFTICTVLLSSPVYLHAGYPVLIDAYIASVRVI